MIEKTITCSPYLMSQRSRLALQIFEAELRLESYMDRLVSAQGMKRANKKNAKWLEIAKRNEKEAKALIKAEKEAINALRHEYKLAVDGRA